MEVQRSSPDDPVLLALLQEQDREYAKIYPPELNFTVPIEELHHPDLRLYVLHDEGRAVGCGALLCLVGFVELKRLYIIPQARQRGLASHLTQHLETQAKTLGYRVIRLETSEDSPGAVRLYERMGFRHIRAFAPYEENGCSVFMEKVI